MVDLFAAYEVDGCGEPGFADRVCVLNERVRDRLVSAGRRGDEVVVTGNPAFDGLRDPAVRDARRCAAQGARLGRTPCLALGLAGRAGKPSLPARAAATPCCRCASRGNCSASRGCAADMELVIRPHPSEGEYRIELGPRQWLSPRSENLHELLQACDGVVVLTSTVGLEARIAGCAVVQVMGSLYTPDAPYLAYGIADAAVPLEGLAAADRCGTRAPAPAADLAPAAPQVLEALSPWL